MKDDFKEMPKMFVESAVYGLYGWFIIAAIAIGAIFLVVLLGKAIETGWMIYPIGFMVVWFFLMSLDNKRQLRNIAQAKQKMAEDARKMQEDRERTEKFLNQFRK
ncbi:hypothetical protein EDC49_0687 [Frederiksenia canicola]|nr:hypothetical protein EDC49_0687 [Frederiksenia canicola]